MKDKYLKYCVVRVAKKKEIIVSLYPKIKNKLRRKYNKWIVANLESS